MKFELKIEKVVTVEFTEEEARALVESLRGFTASITKEFRELLQEILDPPQQAKNVPVFTREWELK